MPTTIDIKEVLKPDCMAESISNLFVSWSNAKASWEAEARETQQYLYATSTRDIMNITRQFDNTTHLPKLMQLREMLITYYLDAIFNLPDFVEWEAYNNKTININTKNSLKALIKDLLNKSGFRKDIEQLMSDYVDFGNAFCAVTNVTDTYTTPAGEIKTLYTGPKAIRIDPMTIYFDPTAVSFEKAPKIVRTVMTLGEVAASVEDNETMKKAFDIAVKKRQTVRDMVAGSSMGAEAFKNDDINIAGLGNLTTYLTGDNVELLTFYGDIFDIDAGKLVKSAKIIVMDRSTVLLNETNKCPIHKCGWRDRKCSLWSMSPLDNVKGMQYMIDFLENKRADIFNFIANPVVKTIGDVELPATLMPGEIIPCDRDSDVEFMRPDTTALAADTYVDRYMLLMEEMVGAPKEAMGFRTPGEKTAFEVQQLSTAASRIFERQVHKFEEEMLEPVINDILKMYIASQAGQVVMLPIVDESGATIFEAINVSDIDGDGRFYAVGSRTYTEKARTAQTLMQLGNSAVYQDELVKNNIDPKVIAQALITTSGLDKFDNILKDNARVYAAAEMQSQVEYAQQGLDEQRVRGIADAQQANV